ncbi:cyclic nucleotide-binding domain-containing protein [Elusimicrobiota bacterium]
MVENDSGLEFLKSFDIFGSFSDDALTTLLSKIKLLELEKGQLLFSEGQTADSLYVIVSGDINITRKDKGDMEKNVSLLGPKSICGDMSLFSGRTKRIAGARANTVIKYYKIHIDLIRELFVADLEGTARAFKAMLLTRYHQLAKSDGELAAIYELSRLIASDLNLENFCQAALELLCFSVPQTNAALLYLLDLKSGDYIQKGEIEYRQAPDTLVFDPAAARVIGLNVGAARMDPLVVNDPLTVGPMLKGIGEAKAIIAMGIVVDGDFRGFCVLMNTKEAFSEEDCDIALIRSFSILLSSAISNRIHAAKS